MIISLKIVAKTFVKIEKRLLDCRRRLLQQEEYLSLFFI